MSSKFLLTVVALLLVCEFSQVAYSKALHDQLSELENLQKIISKENIFQEIQPENQKETSSDGTSSQKDFALGQNESPSSSFNLGLCMNGSNFYQAVKALGVLDGTGVSLIKIYNVKFLEYLTKYGEITLPKKMPTIKPKKSPHYYRKKPRDEELAGEVDQENDDDDDDDDDDQESVIQKRSERPICQDRVKDKYIMAHHIRRLVYRIDTHECEGVQCKSDLFKQQFGTDLGKCAQINHKMKIYIINKEGKAFPKTVEVGSACKCLSYYP